MSSDYLMQQISDMTRALADAIFSSRAEEPNEVFDVLGNFSGTNFLSHVLTKMIHDGEALEAEEMLFEELEKDSSPEMLKIGLDFYKELDQQNDANLITMRYERENILKGLERLSKYSQK